MDFKVFWRVDGTSTNLTNNINYSLEDAIKLAKFGNKYGKRAVHWVVNTTNNEIVWGKDYRTSKKGEYR